MRSIRGAVTALRQLLVHSNHRGAPSYLRTAPLHHVSLPVPHCLALCPPVTFSWNLFLRWPRMFKSKARRCDIVHMLVV